MVFWDVPPRHAWMVSRQGEIKGSLICVISVRVDFRVDDLFQAAAGEFCDPSTTVQPGMLTNVVYQLMQAATRTPSI